MFGLIELEHASQQCVCYFCLFLEVTLTQEDKHSAFSSGTPQWAPSGTQTHIDTPSSVDKKGLEGVCEENARERKANMLKSSRDKRKVCLMFRNNKCPQL